ncbi:pilus assembly protein N-terminal domain-containing protein [Limoniibacter endophyticus]|uniref:Pilus formation protein N-terminal domain-containing protein n=1 Tax=Limoniibacter endophyticus TaxID=1565040 RepID=A0A8J3DH50_9HYPH|nr:pilus assembly protein N-terminal domain-containing protein [Limoniibacter endophyticus]GHC67125.1 hypothetical protein GCM10010136_10890 [Limoniibacter endophyticus]
MRRIPLSIRTNLYIAFLGGVFLATPAQAEINVTINKAAILRIGEAAETVVVGNPDIADATVQDARTIVLTGKNPGNTNIVVLNQHGNPIVDETIFVGNEQEGSVRIYRRAEKQVLSCTPFCESAYSAVKEQ